MTKRDKLRGILEALGRPYAYMVHRPDSTGKLPEMPFITYFMRGTDNFMADDQVYEEDEPISVQIVTTKKDFQLERQFKDLLTQNKIPYNQEVDYYDMDGQFFIAQINI